jgi:hypothetical protein
LSLASSLPWPPHLRLLFALKNNRKIPPPPPNKRDAPHCPPKTPVSTPLHLPLLARSSWRLGEISLRPAAHIGVGFGPFDPPGSTPRARPSTAQPPRPNFLRGAAAGHGARPGRLMGAPSQPSAARPKTSPLRAPLLPPVPLPRKSAAPPPAGLPGRSTTRSPPPQT